MLVSGLLGYSPKLTFAFHDEIELEERSLSLFNPRTKVSFEGLYFSNGSYIADAMTEINHIMRDTRVNVVKPIDPHLLDLISAISIKLKSKEPFHVISGYRSPKTNNLLRKRGKGAAKNSYHLKGQAVDIRLPGHRAAVLRRTASVLKKGGVGFYPKSKFVHIDVGPVRYWRG